MGWIRPKSRLMGSRESRLIERQVRAVVSCANSLISLVPPDLVAGVPDEDLLQARPHIVDGLDGIVTVTHLLKQCGKCGFLGVNPDLKRIIPLMNFTDKFKF